MKQRSNYWLTRPGHNTKKFVYSASLLLLLTLSITIPSLTSDFAIFDNGHDWNYDSITAIPISFFEIHNYLPLTFPKAFAIVDTWTSQDSNTNQRLRAVSFTDANTAHVAGRDGAYRTTNNTGSSWHTLSDIGTTNHIYGIHTVGLVGYTVGATGVIRETINGGQSWTGINNTNNQNLYDLHYDSRDLGLDSLNPVKTSFFVAVGADGTLVSFTRENNVVTRALHSVNIDILTNLYDVHFDNSHSNIWAVGAGGTIVSTNGGITGTWSKQTSGTTENLYKVYFVDANRGWAVGHAGTIIHTVDGGTTWSPQDSSTDNTLSGLSFYDADHGWAVGAGGTVVYTADGGTTWTTQTSGTTNHLYDITMLGPNHGWAVGNNGTVIHGSNTKLMLEDSTPDLDLYNGTLSFEFDKTIDVSETVFSNITITDRDGNNGIPMTNATMSTSDSKTLTIHLNESQRQSITLLQHGSKSPLQINVSATAAISDTIGNNFAGISNAGLTVNTIHNDTFNDDKPPLLINLTPDLDLNSDSILRLEFDETIDVSKTILSKIKITDSNGANGVILTGATLPSTDSDTLTISLTESQVMSITLLQNGENTPVQIDISADAAISDIAGNHFAGITQGQLSLLYVLSVDTWNQQNVQTNTRLLGVHFINADRGWAVGNNGLLVTTTNGGATWSTGSVGINTVMRDVHFVDSNHGWAVGNAGALRTTTDGGTTWTATPSGTTELLFDIYFVDANTGWAVGDNGTVIHTTDGGATWSANSNSGGTTSDLRGVHFSGPGSPGWAVGQDGTIINTPGPGGSWTTQISSTTATLNDVYFIDADRGWVVGAGGTILVTINRGTDWNTLDSNTTTPLNDVYFVDSDQGWVVGTGGTILATNNGGVTWSSQSTPTTRSLFAIHFAGPNDGWAVGNNGIILHGFTLDVTAPQLTDDTPDLDLIAGTLLLQFDEIIDTSATTLSGITITDNNGANGVSLIGATLSDTDSNTLTISLTESQRNALTQLQIGANPNSLQININATAIRDSAGNYFAGITNTELTVTPVLHNVTWVSQYSNTTASLIGVHFANTTQGWAVGFNGTVTTTTDGGITWSAQNSTTTKPLSNIHFANTTHGWAVGFNGTVIATTNGGTTWSSQPSNTTNLLFDVYFVNANNGWAVGADGIIINTTNAGADWSVLDSNNNSTFHATHFIDANHGWIVGNNGTVIAITTAPTTDDVTVFTVQDSGVSVNLIDVHFVDTNNGWAVGNNGTVIATNNGGTTWSILDNDITTHLSNVHFVDTNNGWAVGASGTVIATTDGGTTWNTQSTSANEHLYAIHFPVSTHGWVVGHNGTIIHSHLPDTHPPLLTNNTPNLDLTTGTLLLEFNEIIDTSATTLPGITITDDNGANSVSLAGATLLDTDSATLTISLTESQRNAFILLQIGANPPLLQININDTAIRDSAGNYFAGLTATALQITKDTAPPTLTDTTPDLDLDVSTLTIAFNEIIDASATTPAQINITDSTGVNSVTLTSATLPTTDSNTLTLTLTESQRQSIVTLDSGNNTPLQINISATAIRDITGNAFTGLVNAALTIIPDNTPPILTDTTPDLVIMDRTLTFTFNEHIDVSAITLSEISITNATETDTVTLAGAALPDTDTATVIITLTPTQIQSINDLLFTDTTPLQITVSPSAIPDITGNHFAGTTNIELTVTPALHNVAWVSQISGTTTSLLDVQFTDTNHGWAVGDSGIVIATTDGGTTWSTQISGTTTSLRGAQFTDTNHGWAVGDSGTVIATTDGGTTWSVQDSGTTSRLRGAQFTDTNHGWAVGDSGIVIATTDGGTTWSTQNSSTTSRLRSVHFTDTNHGWAVGNNGRVIATTDGGTTWSTQNSGTTSHLRSVHFTDTNHGWAVGNNGRVITTTDGGTTWSVQDTTTITTRNLRGVHFTDTNHGWAVGRSGTVIATTDGGTTWNAQSTPTGLHLHGIHFSDSTHGWVVGNNGVIIHSLFADIYPPLLTNDTPNLDLSVGTLLLEFNEIIDASATVLSGITITDSNGANNVVMTGATLPDTDLTTVIITLTATQIQSINKLTFTDTAPLQITVTHTAIADLAGNHFAGLTATALETTNDTIPPTLTDTTPNLDLDVSTLTITFNEIIDASATTTAQINISDSTGANSVTLAGATLPTTDSNTLTITLTESQRQSIVMLDPSNNTSLQINISATAIRDNAGNAFAGLVNATLTIIPDSTPPTLTDNTPDLVIMDRTLTFTFDEHIDVSTIALSEISITHTNTTDTDTVTLAGAALPNTNTATVTITLTPAQILSLNKLTFTDTSPLQITVTPTAIADITGNLFAGLTATALQTTTDTAPPTLTDTTPDLVLDVSTLTLTFNEDIDVSATNLTHITITNSTGGNSVTLTGATLPTSDSNTLTITLTEPQIQSITTLYTGNNTPLQINISATAIHDISGNTFAGLINGALTIIPDSTPPTLTDSTPNLVAMDRTLTFTFDEHIDVSAITLSEISITRTNATFTVTLDNATLPNTDSATVIITLTPDQIQSIHNLMFTDVTPLQITITPTAISDITGNHFTGITNRELTVISALHDVTWVSQNSGTTDYYNDVHFANTTHGWAIARYNGIVNTTTDGGITWSTQDISSTIPHVYSDLIYFNGVHFANTTHGWIVGFDEYDSNGIVTATTDGGSTWSTQNSGTDRDLKDVHFGNTTHGWAVGGSGTVIATVNGGTTWSTQNSGTNAWLNGVHFANTTHGWAVGSSGTVLATVNGGTTWSTQNSGTTAFLYDVHFTDTTHGWAVGSSGTVIATVNGGTTWSTQNSGTTAWLNGVHFTDTNHGWAVGGFGTVIATVNGGTTWSTQNSGTTIHLNGIHFSDSTSGWIVGRSGTILHSHFADTHLQLLTDETYLYLLSGTLLLEFDETIDASATLLSGITITDSNGENAVVLTGATLSDTDSSTLTVSLTESQRQSITLLQHGANTPLEIDISGSAIKNPSGSSFAGVTDNELTVFSALHNVVWVSQDSDTTTYFIDHRMAHYDVHFTDTSTHGHLTWAVGSQPTVVGTVIATVNGGTTWSTQNSGTTTSPRRPLYRHKPRLGSRLQRHSHCHC